MTPVWLLFFSFHSRVSWAKPVIASARKVITVIVPAGTASWTKTLVISKPITLIGQTTVSYTNETVNDRTIILDDVPRSINPAAPIIHTRVTSGEYGRGA